MIEITLTKGYVAIVDDQDAEFAEVKWYAQVQYRNVYVRHTINPKLVNGQKTKADSAVLHREVMSKMLGRKLESSEIVDHINGNTLDNRRCNLRVCTNKQNLRNKRLSVTNSTGFKGVSYYTGRSKPYRAMIEFDNKQVFLGYFSTPEAAHAAYCEAAQKYFGEFWRAA